MMFTADHNVSSITTVLPTAASNQVVEAVICADGTRAFARKARGTLLHDRWWKSWVPPISPSRTMLQMLVPDDQIDGIVSEIVELSNMHLQAAGAVFSTPCDKAYFGTAYQPWPGNADPSPDHRAHDLEANLSIIYCVVGHQLGDRIAKAAIRAGAHGPIVYYVEGRGLRDRLGWLRITKDTEQEVLMVIADSANVEEIFDAMAKAGGLHLPGRGFMYRLNIDKGMFNLPSRTAHHQYDANMQQIISAIDHLAGHTHWRDQSVVEVGGDAKAMGLDFLKASAPALFNQVCLSATINRDNHVALMNLMLDAGAPGLNTTFSKNITARDRNEHDHASVSEEYAMFRCITDESVADNICEAIEKHAEPRGLSDLCVTTHTVPRVAKYIPTRKDYRASSGPLAMAS